MKYNNWALKENKTINNKHIGLSAIGEPFDFKIVKANSNGEFHFILDQDLKKSDVILQIFENDLIEKK